MKRVIRHCAVCDTVLPANSSKKRYCSPECRKIGKPEVWNKGTKGLALGRKRTGEFRNCVQCNIEFYSSPGRSEALYCSTACYSAHRWGGSRRTDRLCVICSNPFSVNHSSEKVTCSKECSSEHKSRCHRGEKSSLWRGGKTLPYCGEWKSIRRSVYDRDGYKCVICESRDRIQCHHKIPYRYSQNHDMSNLVTLCRSCHSKEELIVNAMSRQGLTLRWQSLQKQS